jgi:hypothetical protein
MSSAQVQESDVDALLAAGVLSVDGHCPWRQDSDKSWFKAIVPVKVEGWEKPPVLRIVVSVSPEDQTRISFALLWQNRIRVRGLCMGGSHRNPHTDTARWVHQTHKHRWTDKCHDRFAYTPTDISASDPQGLLGQFCAECGIRCTATLEAIPPAQGGLYGYL